MLLNIGLGSTYFATWVNRAGDLEMVNCLPSIIGDATTYLL